MTSDCGEQKYLIYFILCMLVLLSSAGAAVGIDRQLNQEAVEAYASNERSVVKKQVYLPYASSEQRVVEYAVLNVSEKDIQAEQLSEEDYHVLCRIVQAEAGCEDITGKILVANVVLNRVHDERFPDSVSEVVFQYSGNTAQFSPVSDGSFYRVNVSGETVEAVNRALQGEDYSEGALYFAARSAAGTQRMQWFDRCLTRLFAYGGHEFYM